jgi:hypothetical protein
MFKERNLSLNCHGGLGMIRSVLAACLFCFFLAGTASAQNCNSYPNTLTNGTNADATQVMGNFNYVAGCVNTLAGNIASPAQLSGRLTHVSATQIRFAPFNGNLLKINGATFAIPSAGIAGCASTGVYVNGTAAQNLGASTLYYVYAFSNAGTVTCDFSTTGHATSSTAGNVGVEIKSGDDTRSLIGMIRTSASSQFADGATQIFVRSWFNRPAKAGKNTFTANRSTTSSSFVELNTEIRIEFLCWNDENIQVGINGPAFIGSASSDYIMTSVGFDGTTGNDEAAAYSNNTTGITNVGYNFTRGGLAEGYHYATVLGKNSAGSLVATWGDGARRVTLNLGIR